MLQKPAERTGADAIADAKENPQQGNEDPDKKLGSEGDNAQLELVKEMKVKNDQLSGLINNKKCFRNQIDACRCHTKSAARKYKLFEQSTRQDQEEQEQA